MSKRKISKRQKRSLHPHTREMRALGNYLKQLRLDLGMNLRDVSRVAEVSPAHVCKIEQGTVFKTVGVDILLRLAKTYDIPLAAILEEAGLIDPSGGDLPEFSGYLRTKYGLSPQAIRDLETAREVVFQKYARKKESQPSLF